MVDLGAAAYLPAWNPVLARAVEKKLEALNPTDEAPVTWALGTWADIVGAAWKKFPLTAYFFETALFTTDGPENADILIPPAFPAN